jgi:hypothetical protein
MRERLNFRTAQTPTNPQHRAPLENVAPRNFNNKFTAFCEPESSLLCSQRPVSCSRPELVNLVYTLQSHFSLRSVLILISHLPQGLLTSNFASGFFIKTLHFFL